MFYSRRGAFRIGEAVGTEWDEGAVGDYSFAGGREVTSSGYGSLAYGESTVASSSVSVAFGSAVTTSGTAGFAAGANSICSGFACTAIGYTNLASGQGSVAIGYRLSADADYSTAMGQRAGSGGFTGSFIFGDQSTTTTHTNTAANQFMVRAAGGVRLRTTSDLTTGCDLPAGSGVFACTSDRNAKEDFQPLDNDAVLARVQTLPITNWRYIGEPGDVRHIGPMAQDFRAAFGLGTNDTSIGIGDIVGVNMAAIQALASRTGELQQKSAEVDALRAEVQQLQQALARIEQRLDGR